MSIFGGVHHNSYFFVDLVKSARAGCFALPMFQRGIVWGESDVLMLLDSIWRGYPIGYLILWGDMWRAHAQEVRPFRGCNEPAPAPAPPPRKPPPPPPPDTPERIARREQVQRSEEVIGSFKDARIGTIQIAREKDIAFAREVFRRLNTAGKPFTEDEVFACLK